MTFTPNPEIPTMAKTKLTKAEQQLLEHISKKVQPSDLETMADELIKKAKTGNLKAIEKVLKAMQGAAAETEGLFVGK